MSSLYRSSKMWSGSDELGKRTTGRGKSGSRLFLGIHISPDFSEIIPNSTKNSNKKNACLGSPDAGVHSVKNDNRHASGVYRLIAIGRRQSSYSSYQAAWISSRIF